MRATILDGGNQGDLLSVEVSETLTSLLRAQGWETLHLKLHEMNIRPCIGCFGCWVITPGQCRIHDDAPAVTRAIIQSDLAVCLTPVVFGGYSSQLKKALDRSICLVSPFFTRIGGEVHHLPRYLKYPKLLGLGILDSPDEDSRQIFQTLVARNALNIHTPAYLADTLVRNGTREEMRRNVRCLLSQLEVL